jgi:hypothetical protein
MRLFFTLLYRSGLHLLKLKIVPLLAYSASLDTNAHFYHKSKGHSHYPCILSESYQISYLVTSDIAILWWRLGYRRTHLNRAIWIIRNLQLKLGSDGVSIVLIFFMAFVVLWFLLFFNYFFLSLQLAFLYILSGFDL